jgi:hypothetical protein
MLNIFTNQLELFDVHFLRLRSLSEWEEISGKSLSPFERNLKQAHSVDYLVSVSASLKAILIAIGKEG